MDRTALVLGCTGQDGSYLCELLHTKGYCVLGARRRRSDLHARITGDLLEWLHPNLIYYDCTDPESVRSAIEQSKPDEIYNLAAQSHVAVSFQNPAYTFDTIANGTLHLLEVCRKLCPQTRIYQACSSEEFGNSPPPQNERSPFAPVSPYAVAKVSAHLLCRHYRQTYGMFIACGILFNHDSPRRGETFVSRKITRAVTRIKCGLQDRLWLGNLEAKRDFGWAPEYVEAMWRMLQHDIPDDFVIATGESHSVAEFVEAAFDAAGMEPGDYVRHNPVFLRPAEVNHLCGDASKAREVLGWKPTVGFRELVQRMVDADLQLAEEEKLIQEFRGSKAYIA